ncbi:hypothetical protein AB431_28015 [Mycobacterium sp. EPa45]|nr:hypothetical protein AB431_28015 [Mycobacterium sp. EPa45]
MAATAAIAIMLTTTTAPPSNPNPAEPSPRISIEAVHLAALPTALDAAARNGVDASQVANDGADPGGPLKAALGTIVVSAIVAVYQATLLGARLAGSVANVPVIGPSLSGVVFYAALICAWVIGPPIGAVVGALYAVQSLVPGLASPPAPAASARPAAAGRNTVTTPHRSAKSGTRSNRHTAKSALPAKPTAPQQDSIRSRAGSGRGHIASSNRAASRTR